MSSNASNDSADSPNREQRLDELIAELIRAEEAGTPMARDEVLAKHPSFASELTEFFDQRQRIKQLIQPLWNAEALRLRCPHCHNPIELLEESPLSDISCPSCGSSFSLVGDETETRYPTGSKTIGHFELIDHVGIGAFGSVWKARDTKLDRTVAVKIPRNKNLDAGQTEMFLRDARAAAQLKHPNIVSVHEVGKQDDTIYIVSDFIQGATLKEWVTTKRLTPHESAKLCVEVAKAVHHAHETEVIHRDLKPANIMMDGDGNPHVVDFGLAKREAGEVTMTVEGQILGTPAYMSPEQARGEGHKVDRRADIYSLGVILFELLTDELPFRGDKQMLLVQILKDDPPSLRKLNSNVPRDLETICLKCLEKEAAKRYPTACDLAEDLDRYLDNVPIRARRSGFVAHSIKWTRRRPASAALLAMSFVAAGASVATFVSQAYNSRLEIAHKQTTGALQRANELRGQKELALAQVGQAREREEEAREAEERQRIRAEAAFTESRAYHYFLRIAAAKSAWDRNDVRRARRLIAECPDDLRHWEWHYLNRLCNPEAINIQLNSSKSNIKCLSKPAIAKHIAVVTGDGVVDLYISDTGKRETRFIPENKSAQEARLCPDGKHLLVARNANTEEFLQLLELPTGNAVFSYALEDEAITLIEKSTKHTVYIYDIAVAPSGTQFAVSYALQAFVPKGEQSSPTEWYKAVSIWRVRDQRPSWTQSTKSIRNTAGALAWGPDETKLAVGFGFTGIRGNSVRVGSGDLHVWDVTTSQELLSISRVDETYLKAVHGVIFSPDGQNLVTSHGDSTIRIWNLAKGSQAKVVRGHEGPVWEVAFDSKTVLFSAGHDQTIRAWNVLDGKEILKLRGHTADVRHLAVGQAGKFVISAGDDNVVKVWDIEKAEAGQLSRVLHDAGSPKKAKTTAAFSPDGKRIAYTQWAAKDFIVDAQSEAPIGSFRSNGGSLAFSPDGQMIATGGGSRRICVWNAESCELIRELKGRQIGSRVTFGPNNLIAGCSKGQGVTIWNADTGEVIQDIHVKNKSSSMFDVDISFDGKLVAFASGSGREKGEVTICEQQTGKVLRVLKGPDGGIWDIEFSPKSDRIAAAIGVASGAEPGDVFVWDVQSGEVVFQLEGHRQGVWSVAFSTDGQRLASGAGYWAPGPDVGGEIIIWDAKYGQQLLELEGHTGAVMSLDFSPNGQRIVSASADGTVRVWDAPKTIQ